MHPFSGNYGCALPKRGSKPRNRETWDTGNRLSIEEKGEGDTWDDSERRSQDDSYVSRLKCGCHTTADKLSEKLLWEDITDEHLMCLSVFGK